MLSKAGEERLAEEIDPQSIEKILPEVVQAIERAREAGRPIVATRG
jgi:nicotinamidase-related amidase